MSGLRFLLFLLLLGGCGSADMPATSGNGEADSGNVLIVASNYPLYFFTTRIVEGVDGAPEIVLPDIDGDPAMWTPSADQVQLLQSADVVLLNGAGAESWLDLVTLDRLTLLDTTAGVADRLIPLEDAVQHQHGPEGEHSHEGTAFTTWLDPQLAAAQARVVADTLIELAPEREAAFRDNLAALERDLGDLDQELELAFSRSNARPLLFSHPVYQYLERRYDLNGESLHWEPDEEPSTSAWIELQQVLATQPATLMIWEDRPLESTARRLGNMRVKPVVFHTAANLPDNGDYLSVMRANAERIAAEF
jgi:zinc transport system substrate-binding protein